MFVYLSGSGGRIRLPTAVDVMADSPDSPTVIFVDITGEVVAEFNRADVSVYSEEDYGPHMEIAKD